jgi:hypothetical protein
MARDLHLAALVGEERLAHLGDGRIVGDMRVDVLAADLVARRLAIDEHLGGAAIQTRIEPQVCDRLHDRGVLRVRNIPAEQFVRDVPVERTGIDVQEIEAVGKDPGCRGLAGGGAAVDGDESERRADGHGGV